MAIELAAAYVMIIPSLKGASKQIQSQLAGVDTTKVGSKLGQQLGSSIGKSLDLKSIGARLTQIGDGLSSVGSQLTNKITKPALAAAGAVAGIALAGGWKRLVSIDTAKSQLQALGHSAQSIETIMDSALKSVKGTAFGLGDAATVAATAVAAGVEPGKKLTGYLTMIGDAAAVAGISLGDMGYIINQVQTGQVAYTDSLNMLADRGLPIYQWLADAAGVTAAEVKEMASQGQISSEMFFDAIETNIGGAAQIIGQTSFTGALSNMWAALGRLGAAFLDAGGKGGGFFSQLKPLMGEATSMMDALAPKAEELGVKFGAAFARVVEKVREAVTWWRSLDPAMQGTLAKIGGFAVAVGPVMLVVGKIVSSVGALTSGLGSVVGWFGKFGAAGTAAGAAAAGGTASAGAAAAGAGGLFSKLGGFARALLGPIGLVIGLIGAVIAASPELQSQLAGAFQQVGAAIGQVVAVVAPLVQQLVGQLVPVFNEIVSALAPVISMLIAELVPVITTIITVIGQVLAAVMPLVSQIITAVLPLVQMILAAVQPLVQFIMGILVPIIQYVLEVVQVVIAALLPIIQAAVDTITAIVQFWIAVFTGDWEGAWNAVGNMFKGIWDMIVAVVTGVVNIITGVVSAWLTATVTIWNNVWGAIGSFLADVWSNIQSAVSGAINAVAGFISSGLANIESTWNAVWDAVSSFLTSIWNNITSGIQDGWNTVSDFLGGVPDRVMGFFSGIGSWLIDSGKSLLDGFVSGISAGFDAVAGVVEAGLDWVRGLFPFSPAKRGPFSGKGWVLYAGESVGETFMESTGASLRSNVDDVRGALGAVHHEFDLSARQTITSTAPAAAGAPASFTGPLVNIEHVTVDREDRVQDIATALYDRAAQAARSRGVVILGGGIS